MTPVPTIRYRRGRCAPDGKQAKGLWASKNSVASVKRFAKGQACEIFGLMQPR